MRGMAQAKAGPVSKSFSPELRRPTPGKEGFPSQAWLHCPVPMEWERSTTWGLRPAFFMPLAHEQ